MSDTITASLLAIVGTLLGVLAGNRLSLRTAREAIRIQEFNKAASEFQSCFLPVLRILRRGEGNPIASNVLDPVIVQHEIAMLKFRYRFAGDELERFNSAWQDYACDEPKDANWAETNKYFDKEINKRKEKRELAIDNIEKLLKFAEPR